MTSPTPDEVTRPDPTVSEPEICDSEGCTRLATRFDHYPIRGQYCETHFDRLSMIVSSERDAVDEIIGLRAENAELRDALARLTEGRRIEGWAAQVDQPWRWEFGVGEGFTPGPTSIRASLILHDEPRSGSGT